MKKIVLYIIPFLILSCSTPGTCLESTGSIVNQSVEVADFQRIIVYPGISLVVAQGPKKVLIETGKNLISNIDIHVTDNQLIIKDVTDCNWVREYGQTIVYVTTPNLTEIYSKTEKNIRSQGILTFPDLTLSAIDDFDKLDGAGTGDFHISINNNHLIIGTNNVANFYIDGQTQTFSANFYEGTGRIEAAQLMAQNINVYHRGANDMILHPIQSIQGNMYSTGNIICKNHPPIVNVTAHYHGQVIFQ
ncbi:head GIN domain-containing protein [Flavobacterium branchiophilum]|uniref:Putative auto-transporter adhesin head GIN domain-containing protein n=1 Tax=Flavobacterium branchiophilum TaxID=55197 RepID=A0A2H3KB29_9FLAO|nr:head GIN domain-containing protein [Flavobacterium branchiophilum]PDS24158.1 hypothetical protein B0A77_09215 [Flavobacterium branchiophilum]